MSAWARYSIALLVLIACAAAATVGFFFFRDNFVTHYPVKAITADAMRGGEIPWWNFHDNGGQPLAGNPNTLTFYPDNVLLLFLPTHVAFNLHFLLHVVAGSFAIRALCRNRGISTRVATAAAVIYALSGVVVSATAFYNLVTAVALIPLALLGAERRSPLLMGAAGGLMLLAAEPVMLVSTAISLVVIGWRRVTPREFATAAAIAAVIGAPQLIAYSEIAGEVERAFEFSARAVLITSLDWRRVLEIVTWPLAGLFNDGNYAPGRLFSTIFLGVVALPALWQRSRYVVLALVLLALAIGSHNPLVTVLVERADLLRVMRYPEKFVLPMTVAWVVAIAHFLQQSRFRRAWIAATIVPLAVVAWRAAPVDRFAFYDVAPQAPQRVQVRSNVPIGVLPAREEFRLRARALEPLFGAVAGRRFVINRSPDRMHSALSRTKVSRFESATPDVQRRYLQAAGANVPGALAAAAVIPETVPARSMDEAILRFEKTPDLDLRRVAVAPIAFRSAPGQVTRYRERGQRIEVDVASSGPVLLMVNQSYFRAWVALMNGEELQTFPVNIDRLAVLVPQGGRVELAFGRRRGATAVAWIASISLLVLAAFASRIEKRDGRAGQIEGAADEHRRLG